MSEEVKEEVAVKEAEPVKKQKKIVVVSKGEITPEFKWLEEGKGEVHVKTHQGAFMPNAVNSSKRSVIMLRNFVMANPEVKSIIFISPAEEEFTLTSAEFVKQGN